MSDGAPTLRFLGGARTVTGSRFLLSAGERRVLVDCGMFQGLKEHRLQNWEPFPVDPGSIDAVVLTHAHIDHSGYVPALVRDGFAGPIVCSQHTAELCQIILRDAAYLQEEQARHANRGGYSKHRPALPLYTRDDAEAAIAQLAPRHFDQTLEVAPGVTGQLRWAGHILGAASVLLTVETQEAPVSVFFSGDVGRPTHPILEPPKPPPSADVVVVESTYGDRDHPDDAVEQAELAAAISDTAGLGGMVVIPAFAVDRTEVVLHQLARLEADGRIPQLPIYVDSPMALDVLRIYRRAYELGDRGLRQDIEIGTGFETDRITECRTTQDSIDLAELTYPSIIISASGMATGGRVLHHLARLLPDPKNTIILTGFQADGTRGRRLLDGERSVKMFGHYVPVRARIVNVENLSVHADRSELIGWLQQAAEAPKACYIVHGAERSSEAFADAVEQQLAWNAVIPHAGESVLLP